MGRSGDLNGDGKLDLAVSSGGTSPGKSVLSLSQQPAANGSSRWHNGLSRSAGFGLPTARAALWHMSVV
jgi:hypothetical protein